MGGIHLGQGDPEAEAFVEFQRYVKDLQLRGVLLAVCSKKDEATARAVFENHSEMVLRLPDISCFVANWEDKATNLRKIAAYHVSALNAPRSQRRGVLASGAGTTIGWPLGDGGQRGRR